MTMQDVKEFFFPTGNVWFYIPILIWINATAIFYIMFPALLFAGAKQYSVETGYVVDYTNTLIITAGFLHELAFNLLRVFILFLIASAIFDAIESNRRRRRGKGYL